jgi:hypothetical protein
MARRLYLDTADLFDIGDGRADAAELGELRAAMADTGTMLVFNRDHLHDAAKADSGSRERLLDAVESFEPVLLVMRGPGRVEPLTADRADIELTPWRNVREEANSAPARAWLGPTSQAYASAQSTREAVQKAARDVGMAPLRLDGKREAFERALVLLAKNASGDAEKARGIRALVDIVRMAFEWLEAPAQWPGQSFGLQVLLARDADAGRSPVLNDLVDIDHVQHFPYVDVATCDRAIWRDGRKVLEGALSAVPLPRRPVLVRTKRLGEVAAAVRSLVK